MAAAIERGRGGGETALPVLLVAVHGGASSTDRLVGHLVARGGTVHFVAPEIGYVRAELALDEILSLRSVPGLADYLIDRPIGWSPTNQWSAVERPAAMGQGIPSEAPERPLLPVGALTAPSPYVPVDEIGADRLRAVLPEADGRGVTIGIIESSYDYAHPALQSARTLDGGFVPKTAGLIDPTWFAAFDEPTGEVRRARIVSTRALYSSTGVVEYQGHHVHLPSPGHWQIGTWRRATASAEGTESRGIEFLVAWRDTLEAWLDTNRNHDFRDDAPVPDVNLRSAVGSLPADSANDLGSVSFVVAFGGTGRPHVYTVGSSRSSHTSMVAGVAAGASFFGGPLGGVAPGARLLPVIRPGGGVAGLIESFLAAARDPRVDVITHQSTSFSAFPHAASALPVRLLERIATYYDKPMFAGAGNAGRFGSVALNAAAPSIVAVGAYVSQRSYLVNEGRQAADVDNLASYSSRGPMPDGARKPDLLAPTQMLTTATCADTVSAYGAPARRGAPPSTVYRLPPCYMLGSGTSTAAPIAAGAAALLISAARLAGLPPAATSGRAIRWALMGSARRLDAIELHKQGAGLLRVDDAWSRLLEVWAGSDGVAVADTTSTVPFHHITARGTVRNAYAEYLASEGGAGLYMEVSAGDHDAGWITLTREDGPAGPLRYVVRLRENGGAFALSLDTVLLPRGVPVPVAVSIAPPNQGLHEAVMELVDAGSGRAVRRVALAAMAPAVPAPGNGFAVEWKGDVAWSRSRLLPLRVPAGTQTLRVVLHSPNGEAHVYWHGPHAASTSTMMPLSTTGPGESATLVLHDPWPGVWTLEVTASPRQPPETTVYHIVAVAVPSGDSASD